MLVCFALIFSMLFGMFSISQAASYSVTLKPLKSNPRTTLTVSPHEHTITVSISGGIAGSSLKSYPSWVTVKKNASTYTVKVTPNTNTANRNGDVVFTKSTDTYELHITQTPFVVKNSSGAVVSSLNFKVAGETKKLITSQTCTQSGSVPSWAKLSKSGNTYSITASPNVNGSSRSFTLTFTYTTTDNGYNKIQRSVKITQGENSLTGVPGDKTYSYGGGSFSFTPSAATGSIDISTLPSWLTKSKSGNTYTIKCSANSGAFRSAIITVSVGNIKKSFTVKQYGYIVGIARNHKGAKNGDQYTDWYYGAGNYRGTAWCACFASYCAQQAGLNDGVHMEKNDTCFDLMENFFKPKSGKWLSYSKTAVPSIGSLVFFDWNQKDDGTYRSKKGVADHVGIVSGVVKDSNGKLKGINVIEGNRTYNGKKGVWEITYYFDTNHDILGYGKVY